MFTNHNTADIYEKNVENETREKNVARKNLVAIIYFCYCKPFIFKFSFREN